MAATQNPAFGTQTPFGYQPTNYNYPSLFPQSSPTHLAGQGIWGQLSNQMSNFISSPEGIEAAKKDPLGYFAGLRLFAQSDPEFLREERQQTLKDYLAYAKEMGDQQMKYRMTNDIIANLGSAARSAFSRYTDPRAIAQGIAGIGSAYAQGAQATAGLTQLGAGQPEPKYFRV